MFVNSLGRPLDLNELRRRVIVPILKAAKLEWKGWHAFRRGLATNLHALGIDDETIQHILRHSTVTVTQQSYIKRLPAQTVAAMRTLESSLLDSNWTQQEATATGQAIPAMVN